MSNTKLSVKVWKTLPSGEVAEVWVSADDETDIEELTKQADLLVSSLADNSFKFAYPEAPTGKDKESAIASGTAPIDVYDVNSVIRVVKEERNRDDTDVLAFYNAGSGKKYKLVHWYLNRAAEYGWFKEQTGLDIKELPIAVRGNVPQFPALSDDGKHPDLVALKAPKKLVRTYKLVRKKDENGERTSKEYELALWQNRPIPIFAGFVDARLSDMRASDMRASAKGGWQSLLKNPDTFAHSDDPTRVANGIIAEVMNDTHKLDVTADEIEDLGS